MRIVIIRHGQTMANVINDEGTALYTGTLNNELTSLTEQGKNQARLLAEDDIVKSIEKVYSSDLIRAMQTARLAKPGYELNLSENLRERCLGIFSHYHAIRCLFLNIFKIEPKEKVFKLQIQHCTPYVIEGNSINNLKLVSHDLKNMFEN